MTAAGADDPLGFVSEKKKDNNLLSMASNMDPSQSIEGYKILLEQAIYEMTRGSYSVALEYLNRAVQVKYFSAAIATIPQN